jgi:hypothetical protein
MRQLRIKTSLCSNQKIMIYCNDDYSFSNEEKDSFAPGWINEISQIFSSTIVQAFEYQTNEELDTYITIGEHGSYSGNGFVYEFRGRLTDLQSNLSALHQFAWIDNRTRAVIIQISLYNPNSQLFTSVILLTEFLSTGEIVPQSRFEPFDFHLAFTSISQLICTIFYIIIIIYFMFIEIQSLFHLKWSYFRQF